MGGVYHILGSTEIRDYGVARNDGHDFEVLLESNLWSLLKNIEIEKIVSVFDGLMDRLKKIEFFEVIELIFHYI